MKIGLVGWGVETQSAYRYYSEQHQFVIGNEEQRDDFPDGENVTIYTIEGERQPGLVGNVSDLSYLDHYDDIRTDIEKAIPGFENYNERVRKPGGFYLPNAVRDLSFRTLTQKAHFTVSPIIEHLLQEHEYIMMTVRSHDQFNTTIYGLNDRYRGIHQERRIIFMNEKDIAREKLTAGDIVDLHNHHGGVHRQARKFVVVPYQIPEKCTATYFPETNVLVPIDSTADKSGTPTSKTVVIRIVRHQTTEEN